METRSVHGQRAEKPKSKVSTAPVNPQQGATGDNRSSRSAATRHRSPELCDDPGDGADAVKFIQEKIPVMFLGTGRCPLWRGAKGWE